LLEQHSSDPNFFQKCRSALKLTPTVHGAKDRRFQWLSEFMQENDLSLSQMAQRLKVSAATITRLLASSYTGNVEKMLQRVQEYRREQEGKAADKSTEARPTR
jgi:AraC-like DNA-binding protein